MIRTDTPARLAIRTHLAVHGAQERLAAGLESRARALRDDGERGSQAAEYAMVGGVGAAACGTIAWVLKEHPELLQKLLETVFGTVSSWFKSLF
ncbi:MAG: hypothetical protein H0V93_00010 [Euzebyales bacterium]|jgi:hypothetical protein|nr:hypothetical protein [Euzebyales bacterium]